MEVTAVIPVREGSIRVQNKNFRPFAGSSLLEIKINQLIKVKNIDKIIVSTDSKEMIEIARNMGVEARERPPEYCDEKTKSFCEVVEYIAKNEVETDTVAWIPCVCPLVGTKKIEEAINFYKNLDVVGVSADSVISVKSIQQYILDRKGLINFSINDFKPSQELPEWYTVVNAFYIAKTEDMIKWKFLYGKKPYLYKIGKVEAIDVDDWEDFRMAEYLYKAIVLHHD